MMFQDVSATPMVLTPQHVLCLVCSLLIHRSVPILALRMAVELLAINGCPGRIGLMTESPLNLLSLPGEPWHEWDTINCRFALTQTDTASTSN